LSGGKMTSNGAYSLNPNLTWEKVGEDVLVLAGDSKTSHHLTGHHAEVFLALTRGDDTGKREKELADLISLGLVLGSRPRGEISRRRLVAGVTAGATIGALSLPSVALASSFNGPALIAADVTLANWRIDSYGTGFFLLNTTTLDQAGLSDIFEIGDLWEVEILDFGADLTESATVAFTGGLRRLNFVFDPVTPPTGSVTARLRSSAKNLVSSPFTVSLLPPPP
jgi:hypothetical protein